MRTAATLSILLAVTAIASADPPPPPVEPMSDAIAAPTLDAALEAAIREDDSCHPHCTFDADRTLTLANGLRASIRHQTNTGMDATGYVVTFTAKDRSFVWATADGDKLRSPAVSVIAESSGMGKSLRQALDLVEVSTTKSMLFARFVVTSTLTHFNDPPAHPASGSATHLEYLIACRFTTETPACTAVTPVSHYDDTHITVVGNTTIKRNAETIRLR